MSKEALGSLMASRGQADWWRGDNCNFLVDKETLTINDGPEKYILEGLVPSQPIITKNHGVTTFGSCFATGIFVRLKEWGYNVDPLKSFSDKPHHTHISYHGSGMFSAFTMLQQLEWAYENKVFSEDIWYDKPDRLASNDEEIRKSTRLLFDHTDVFIMTLGISEVWYHKDSGHIFWRAVPKGVFDPNKHGFKVCSCKETIDAIEKIIKIIRQYRPNAYIIFTVSPVRLLATFRPIQCIPANSASKAILRASLDEALRNHEDDNNLFYFPSYELITDLNGFAEDNRHPKTEAANNIMKFFKKYYLIQ